jgi:hypothetical protein
VSKTIEYYVDFEDGRWRHVEVTFDPQGNILGASVGNVKLADTDVLALFEILKIELVEKKLDQS